MDKAVREALDDLLDYMRVTHRAVAMSQSGDMAGKVPDSATYLRAIAWSHARGGLQILEHLQLITNDERDTWMQEARRWVERPPGV